MSDKKRPYPEYIYDLLAKELSHYIRDVINATKDYEGQKAAQRAYDHENRHEIGPDFRRPRTPTRDVLDRAERNVQYLKEVMKYFSIHFMGEPDDTR